MLPPDDHVHSEWSWDTLAGDMERTCARAVEIGLPSVAFTEHADFSPYLFHDSEMSYMPSEFLRHMGGTTVLRQPEIDVDAYLACIERCRQRFPALRILTGVEISEPHWHPGKVAQLVAGNRLERVLASMHSRRVEGGARLLDFYFASESPHEVVRSYLEEILQMIEGSSVFQVLAHIDYPIRHWPRTGTAYQPSM
ncbi:MAG: PHP domain-containing protein, partial [Chloroflexota bacterium]